MIEISTLLVVPRTEICNAKCKFCITKNMYEMDGFERVAEGSVNAKRLEKAAKFSKQLGVRDSNITGGTEPTLEKPENLSKISNILSDYFGRVNIYTNGANFLLKTDENKDIIKLLADSGLTNASISRAHYDDSKNSEVMGLRYYDIEKTVSRLDEENIDTKISCLLLQEYVGSDDEIIKYLDAANNLGVDKVIFRELLPLKGNGEYEKWLRKNYVPVTKVHKLMEAMNVKKFHGLWDQIIWDYDGVGVTIWPDGQRKDTVNNGDLIYMPDNRLYSSWNTKASRIM